MIAAGFEGQVLEEKRAGLGRQAGGNRLDGAFNPFFPVNFSKPRPSRLSRQKQFRPATCSLTE